MKKFKKMFIVLTVLVIAASFMTACKEDGEDIKKDNGDTVTYTLNAGDMLVAQGDTQKIVYTLTASDGSSTASIPVDFSCTTCTGTCEILDGDSIDVPDDAVIKPHNITATAKKDNKVVATDTFTVTVKSIDDIVITDIVINNMSIFRVGSEEEARTIVYNLFDGTVQITSGSFLNDVVVEFESDTLEITNGIIESDKTYEEDDYEVNDSDDEDEIDADLNDMMDDEDNEFGSFDELNIDDDDKEDSE